MTRKQRHAARPHQWHSDCARKGRQRTLRFTAWELAGTGAKQLATEPRSSERGDEEWRAQNRRSGKRHGHRQSPPLTIIVATWLGAMTRVQSESVRRERYPRTRDAASATGSPRVQYSALSHPSRRTRRAMHAPARARRRSGRHGIVARFATAWLRYRRAGPGLQPGRAASDKRTP